MNWTTVVSVEVVGLAEVMAVVGEAVVVVVVVGEAVEVVVVDCYFVAVFERCDYFAVDVDLDIVADRFDTPVVDFDVVAVEELDFDTVVEEPDSGTVAAVEPVVVDCDTVVVGSNVADRGVDCNFVDDVDSVDNLGTSPMEIKKR